MISCLPFGSDIFDTSLLLMFMFSCHKWNVALFHGFHLGFACCVVLAHVIVTMSGVVSLRQWNFNFSNNVVQMKELFY